MSQYSITINDQEYTGETASAKEQYEALHIALNSQLVLGLKDDITEKGLVLSLMSLRWDELQKLEKLLVKGKITRDADDVPAAQNLFRDDPASWALLVGEAAKANLRGFYSLSGGKSADAGETMAAQ